MCIRATLRGPTPTSHCASRQHRTARSHPPLGTDSLTAQAVTDAAEAVYESEVVAPLIRVGVAKERREFAWTL